MSTRCPAPVTSISRPPPPRPELMLYTSRPTSFLAGLGMWHVALCEEGEARPARASGPEGVPRNRTRSGLALKGRFCLWRARAVPSPVTHRPPSQLSAWRPAPSCLLCFLSGALFLRKVGAVPSPPQPLSGPGTPARSPLLPALVCRSWGSDTPESQRLSSLYWSGSLPEPSGASPVLVCILRSWPGAGPGRVASDCLWER